MEKSIDIKKLEEDKNLDLEYLDCTEEDNNIEWEKLIEKLEEDKNLDLEYLDGIEEDNNTESETVDIDDLETYNAVKFIYDENIKLKYIVKDEVNKLHRADNISHRERRNKVMELVRANCKYKTLSNKNKLSSCVTSVINKNKVLYSFDLECKIFEIFITSCNKRFEEVCDLLEELKGDIENTVRKNMYIYPMEEYSPVYQDKLEEISTILDTMLSLEQYRKDASLKYDLLEFIDLRTSKEINSKYKNSQGTRRYKSKVRVSRKQETKRKAIELKNNGLGNNQIAITLGKSKGYISDLLRNKK